MESQYKQSKDDPPYLAEELIGNCLTLIEIDLVGRQCTLDEQAKCQLRHVCFGQGEDSLMSELEDLATLLTPFLIL